LKRVDKKQLFKRYKASGFSGDWKRTLSVGERRALDEYMRYAFRE
jgi:hypothetical protein